MQTLQKDILLVPRKVINRNGVTTDIKENFKVRSSAKYRYINKKENITAFGVGLYESEASKQTSWYREKN